MFLVNQTDAILQRTCQECAFLQASYHFRLSSYRPWSGAKLAKLSLKNLSFGVSDPLNKKISKYWYKVIHYLQYLHSCVLAKFCGNW